MDKDVIETLLSATDALRQHSNELQLQQIRLILTIARSNAIGDKPSTQQLSEVLDMPQEVSEACCFHQTYRRYS